MSFGSRPTSSRSGGNNVCLGLGGVTPAFLAMGAELAPKRLRDVFVTVLFASFPGGGLIATPGKPDAESR